MTVRLTPDGHIRLEGICPVDDAEPLLRLLSSQKEFSVDWRACEQAHSAVIQLLLAAKRPILGPPANDFLQVSVAPLLVASGGPDASATVGLLPKRNQ